MAPDTEDSGAAAPDPLLADDATGLPETGPALSDDPTVNETSDEDASGPTAEQLDADQRIDEAEQDAAQAQDDAERAQLEAEEQQGEDEAADYRQRLVSLQQQTDQQSGGLVSTIVQALNPFASDVAEAHAATSPHTPTSGSGRNSSSRATRTPAARRQALS